MSAMTPCPKDSPLMREWENYNQSDEYANSFKWAAHEEHRKGSMWAAFMAGFLAANPSGAKPMTHGEILTKNMELAGVIRALRANAREDAARIERLERERDEAEAAIPAGEWVAYKDYKVIYEKARRLLVAINKRLPIGCFMLIHTEYHDLHHAIYGKEGAK